MRPDLYAVKTAIVVITAVMCAVGDSTFNTFVCAFLAHFIHLHVCFRYCGSPQYHYPRVGTEYTGNEVQTVKNNGDVRVGLS